MSKLPKAIIDKMKETGGEKFADIVSYAYNLGREVGMRDAVETLKKSIAHTHGILESDETYVDPVYPD